MKNNKALQPVVVIAFCLMGLLLLTGKEEANARPKFVKVFAKTYPDLKPAVKKEKCKICHPGKKKKELNKYGEEMGKVVPKKNIKDEEKIKKALIDTEDKTSEVAGKTFGELIKAGKMPNVKE